MLPLSWCQIFCSLLSLLSTGFQTSVSDSMSRPLCSYPILLPHQEAAAMFATQILPLEKLLWRRMWDLSLP
jgi:hypothetical protein